MTGGQVGSGTRAPAERFFGRRWPEFLMVSAGQVSNVAIDQLKKSLIDTQSVGKIIFLSFSA